MKSKWKRHHNDEIKKSVNDLINEITKKNKFKPVSDATSTGLSSDLSDDDIESFIEHCSQSKNEQCAYKYYYDKNNCILYKSSCGGSLEEYIGDCLWNYSGYIDMVLDLVEVTEEEANDIIKEFDEEMWLGLVDF
ncbi:MAG: hypothetical protein IKW30_01445 [Lachnospiraceae bacterium]|nr:hypothetical protein [Lachnospiraceae bacterium]